MRSNTWDYIDLTVLRLLGQSWWDHSQWRAALQSLLPRHAVIMVLPVNSEILDYGDSSAAATSLIGKDVHLFLKWTAEPGYNNHRYKLPVNPPQQMLKSSLFSLYRLSQSPAAEDLLVTNIHVSQLDRGRPVVRSSLTFSVPLLTDGMGSWFEVKKVLIVKCKTIMACSGGLRKKRRY